MNPDGHGLIALREADPDDAELIGRLHADSWRVAYRGILGDDYVDRVVDEERRRVWRDRFAPVRAGQTVIIVEQAGKPIGFTCLLLDREPDVGALIDALHVLPGHKGQGHGTRLMDAAARALIKQRPGQKLHLWVYEANEGARAFYVARHGRLDQSKIERGPDGSEAPAVRYVWDDPRTLLI